MKVGGVDVRSAPRLCADRLRGLYEPEARGAGRVCREEPPGGQGPRHAGVTGDAGLRGDRSRCGYRRAAEWVIPAGAATSLIFRSGFAPIRIASWTARAGTGSRRVPVT